MIPMKWFPKKWFLRRDSQEFIPKKLFPRRDSQGIISKEGFPRNYFQEFIPKKGFLWRDSQKSIPKKGFARSESPDSSPEQQQLRQEQKIRKISPSPSWLPLPAAGRAEEQPRQREKRGKKREKNKNKNPFALTRVHWTLPADPSAQPQLAVLAQTLPARCLIYGRAGIGGRDRCPGTGTPRQVHVNPVPAGPQRGLQLGIAVSGFALRFGGRWGWVGVLLFLCV